MLPFRYRQDLYSLAISLFVAVFILSSSFSAFSQAFFEKNGETFQVLKNGSKYSAESVIQTFESAKLTFHRFATVSNIIMLDDGTEVELFSATRLTENGIISNPSSYAKGYPEGYQKSVFGIAKGTILTEQRPTINAEKN